MYMWVKITLTSMKQTKPITRHRKVPLSRQYNYQLFIFKQQISKFSQNTLFHFISKCLKIEGVLLCPIILISKSLKIDYCKLWTAASIFEHVLNQFSKLIRAVCYFSINRSFLTKKKAIIGSLRQKKLVLIISRYDNINNINNIQNNNIYTKKAHFQQSRQKVTNQTLHINFNSAYI